MRRNVGLTWVVFLAPLSLHAESKPVDFDRDIRPILATHCLSCHGPDERSRKAKLRLDVPDQLFEPRGEHRIVDRAKPEESELLLRVTSGDRSIQMPPPEAARRPTATERATFRLLGYSLNPAYVEPVQVFRDC